jgi:cell shape-determining protein MreD
MLAGQFFLKRYFVSFPDFTLLLVIATGVFFSARTALLLAFAAAFARNSLMVSSLGIDLLLFPTAALLPAFFGKLFKRNNPLSGMLISFFSYLMIATGQVFYMNAVHSTDVSVADTIRSNILTAALTVLFYPAVLIVVGSISRPGRKNKTVKGLSVIKQV